MNTNWKNLRDLIEYPSSGILSKVVEKSEKVDVSLFNMAKGTEMSEHTSTRNGLIYVLEGKGTFTLEGKVIAMEPGVFFQMASNAIHSIKAEANTSFVLILFT